MAEIAALKTRLAQLTPSPTTGQQPLPSPFISEQTHKQTDTPPNKTAQLPGPTPTQLAMTRSLLASRGLRRPKSTPEEILAQITALKVVIISGVNSAGYGDKRTEFRSLAELRQILSDLEEELENALGSGGRIRQIRMTTAADKGL